MKKLIVLFFAVAASNSFSQQIFKKKQNLLGSPFEITVVASDSIQGNQFLELAISEVKRVENLISDWIPTSQISNVNKNAGIGPVKVDSEVFNSTVQMVGKSIENKDRTLAVIGNLTSAVKSKLLSGMFVEAFIITTSKKGIAVPNEAVFLENNKSYVLVLQPNSKYNFKKVIVNLGEKNEKFTEILPNNSVTLNTQILTKGVFDITN